MKIVALLASFMEFNHELLLLFTLSLVLHGHHVPGNLVAQSFIGTVPRQWDNCMPLFKKK